MTTEQLLDRLAARLGLTDRQRGRLLIELADAVTLGLQCEGRAGLGPLGHVRLGAQEARSFADGRHLPARPVLWLRPGNDLTRAIEVLPVEFARLVAADTTPRSVWDPAPAREREREREREGVGR